MAPTLRDVLLADWLAMGHGLECPPAPRLEVDCEEPE